MKKIISLMLSFLITSSLVIGCSNTKEDNSDKSETIQKSTEKVTVNMGAPDGLPAIAIAKLSQENPKIKDNYEVKYNLEATSDALSTDVMKENLDMAIVPSNMAATAYNKTSNYQILGTVGMGSFYLVSSDKDVTGLNDSLKNKEVGSIGKNLTPDITVQALLKEQKVDTSKITFNYSNEASDLVSLMATGKLTTGIVPEPALSGLLAKNSNLKVICAVNDIWKDVYKNENGYAEITLKNEKTETNSVKWKKQGNENVILTYIYDANVDLSNIDITAQEKVSLYNDKEITSNEGKVKL